MKILILGIVRQDYPTLRDSIERELSQSIEHSVAQHWMHVREPKKFVYFNDMLEYQPPPPDYILFVDDDVRLPAGFLDQYIRLVEFYQFALAQPARSQRSTGSHPFVFEKSELIARQTRFVECGPVFSMNREAQACLLPFDNQHSGMGGGRDFVWPHVLELRHLKLGIIDAVPVDHNFREDGVTYDRSKTRQAMQDYLARTRHIAPEDARTIVTAYPHVDETIR